MFMSNKAIITTFLILLSLGIGVAVYTEKGISITNRKKDCVPYNLLVDKKEESISLKWNTKDSCSGVVKFGSDIENLDYWLYSQKEKNLNFISIDRDKYRDINYFVIISDGILYGLDGKVVPIN